MICLRFQFPQDFIIGFARSSNWSQEINFRPHILITNYSPGISAKVSLRQQWISFAVQWAIGPSQFEQIWTPDGICIPLTLTLSFPELLICFCISVNLCQSAQEKVNGTNETDIRILKAIPRALLKIHYILGWVTDRCHNSLLQKVVDNVHHIQSPCH